MVLRSDVRKAQQLEIEYTLRCPEHHQNERKGTLAMQFLNRLRLDVGAPHWKSHPRNWRSVRDELPIAHFEA